MKRTLITAVALYLLYERQRRVERRQKLWKLRTEAGLREWLLTTDTELNDFADRNWKWAERLVEQIPKALKEGAR